MVEILKKKKTDIEEEKEVEKVEEVDDGTFFGYPIDEVEHGDSCQCAACLKKRQEEKAEEKTE